MSETVVRLVSGELLPTSVSVVRILATEEEPVGTGTAMRTVYTLLVSDDRYWLTDAQKLADPIRPLRAHPDSSTVGCAP